MDSQSGSAGWLAQIIAMLPKVSVDDVAIIVWTSIGAVIAYFLCSYPEEDKIKRRLENLFPGLKPEVIERCLFVILVVAGTIVVKMTLNPTNKTMAFLGGFTSISVAANLGRDRAHVTAQGTETAK